MTPDHPYYSDWATSDDNYQPPIEIDLATIVIFIWVLVGSLL